MHKPVGIAHQKAFERCKNMKKLLVGGLGMSYGGVSNVIMTFLRNVDRQEFDISIIETYDSVFHDEISALGVKIIRLPIFKKYFRYKKAVKRLFKENRFDVVWINNTAKVDILLMKYAKRSGAKIISHSHGSVQEGSRLKKLIFNIINRVHEKEFYKLLDLGIACSQSSAEYFYNPKYMKGNLPVVLPNAIDCNKYAFSYDKRVQARSIFNAGETDIVLACIGRICEVKNLGFALKVMLLLPDEYKLVIIGNGDSSALRSEIESNGLEDRVFILGGRGDVDLLINGVDIVLLPSLSEGLPMIVLEAQANGTKCIISDKVSSECKALDSTVFATIQDASVWADIIKSADTTKTENAEKIMIDGGFDVSTYSQRLAELINNA